MNYTQSLNSALSGLMQSYYGGKAGAQSGEDAAYKRMQVESEIGRNSASAQVDQGKLARMLEQRQFYQDPERARQMAEGLNSGDPVSQTAALLSNLFALPDNSTAENVMGGQMKLWDRGDAVKAMNDPDFRLGLNASHAAQKGDLFAPIGTTGYAMDSGSGSAYVASQPLAQLFADSARSEINRNNRPPASSAGGSLSFTPDAIDSAANRYNFDGTLPTLGMGPAAAAARAAILNRAAALNSGNPSHDLRAGQMVNKANAAALAQLQKQQTMVSAFEKNAAANADIALKASAAVDRTGVLLFNKWLMAGRKATGDVDVVRFNAANETFVNEYAKIMSGSMGNTPVSDSARAHAHEMLSIAKTQEQYAGTIALLQQEMHNRMAGMESEKQALIASMRKQSASKQFPATQDAAAQQRRNANRPKAVQWLKGRNIQTQDQFRAAVQSLRDGGWSASEIQQIQQEAGL